MDTYPRSHPVKNDHCPTLEGATCTVIFVQFHLSKKRRVFYGQL